MKSTDTFFVICNDKGQYLVKQERSNWYMGVGSKVERTIMWSPNLNAAQLWHDVKQTKKVQNMQARGEFTNAGKAPLKVVVCTVTRAIS